MSNRTIAVTDQLYEYLLRVTVRESELLARLRRETRNMRGSGMQIAPEQGQFMTLLAELTGARRALEIGVYTGYSSLCVAAALPDDGQLIACDVSEEFTAVARRYWKEAKLDHKIELRLAPALQTLDALLAGDAAGSFDFTFIDADKAAYDAYYERCLTLLRRGGLIAVDNALWNGSVADATRDDEDTRAIRALNQKVATDVRVSMSLVPIGDGLLLARKR
ncbi:MAG TPA: class I SAM-dependent methyltransferase [Polyangiaceae bacterium]|nr:class I SAM-dependent methyltransferase [Polyangiaceae bacterium]